MSGFSTLLTHEIRRQRQELVRATLLAMAVAAAAVALLGLSGWFITAAGAAGLAGVATAHAFNYLLPSATIRLLAIVRTGARYGERLASHAAAFHILARIRPALYRAIAAAPPAVAMSLTSGEASARLVQDVGAIEMAIARQPARAGAFAAVTSGATLTLLASPLAALALTLIAAATVAVGILLARRLDRLGRDVQQLQGALRDLLTVQLAAAPELRCYGMGAAAMTHVARLDALLAETRRRQATGIGALEGLVALAVGAATVVAFLIVAPAGIPLAALCALAASVTVDGIRPLLKERAARGEYWEAEARLAALFVPPTLPALAPSFVALDLPGLGSLAPMGARIAIIGASGSGKTSLVETLLGLRTSPNSAVRLGGRPIDELNVDALRSTFAWTPQDAQLLAGTVRDNLRLADPMASEAAMWSALDDALIAEVVRRLPKGLDTWIGEDGERLSGGERRRLSLARAYLAYSPWLLLDEPTEALDEFTEQAVVRRLACRLIRTGQGLIVITHRDAVLNLCRSHYHVGSSSRLDKEPCCRSSRRFETSFRMGVRVGVPSSAHRSRNGLTA